MKTSVFSLFALICTAPCISMATDMPSAMAPSGSIHPTSQVSSTIHPIPIQPSEMAPTSLPNSQVANNPAVQIKTGQTILDLISSSTAFSTLAKVIKVAGIEQQLKANGPMTFFAPTNAAFEKLGAQKLGEFMDPANKTEVAQILSYHIVPMKITPESMSNGQLNSVTTLEGRSVNLIRQGQNLQVQNAASIGGALNAGNGNIIPIDSVLTPEGQK